ncbi:nipblb, partial [Symbiodinium necroappetens]
PGYDVEPNNSTIVKGMNAGKLIWEPMHRGYGAVVALGSNYTVSGNFRGDIATELSDVVLEEVTGQTEAVKVTIGNYTCQVAAVDDRSWLGVQGRAPWTAPSVSCLTQAYEASSLVKTTTAAATVHHYNHERTIAYRLTFIDVNDGQREGADPRARARSLSPTRVPDTETEPLVQDLWARRQLRSLRQGQNATAVDAPQPSRDSAGHPTLCNKPCIGMAKRGLCQRGSACGLCHYQHDDAKPDKRQRLLMSTMPRAELLHLLADLLRERAEQDGVRDVSLAVAVLSVHAGLLPGRLQTKSRKLQNLRQVLQRRNFAGILSMAAKECEGRSREVLLQELRALRQCADA